MHSMLLWVCACTAEDSYDEEESGSDDNGDGMPDSDGILELMDIIRPMAPTREQIEALADRWVMSG